MYDEILVLASQRSWTFQAHMCRSSRFIANELHQHIWNRNNTLFAWRHIPNFPVVVPSRIRVIGCGLQEGHSVEPYVVRLWLSPLWFTMFQKCWQWSTNNTVFCWRKLLVFIHRQLKEEAPSSLLSIACACRNCFLSLLVIVEERILFFLFLLAWSVVLASCHSSC